MTTAAVAVGDVFGELERQIYAERLEWEANRVPSRLDAVFELVVFAYGVTCTARALFYEAAGELLQIHHDRRRRHRSTTRRT